MSLNSIAIDITYRCNFRCKHCYNCSGEHTRKEMSDEEVLSIVQQCANEKPGSLCICGGETFLREKLLYDIGRNVKQISPSTSLNIVTNGYLLNDSNIKKLKQSGFDLIQVSLDGATPESHNWLRGNNLSYKRAINAIRLAVNEGFDVGVACAPTTVNRDEIAKVAKLCNELGVKMFRVQPLMIIGRGNSLKDKLLTSNDYFKLSQNLAKLRLTKEYSNMNFEWGDPIQHLEFIYRKNERARDITINAYGEIMSSPYIPLVLGNLIKIPLHDYIENGLLDQAYSLPIIKKLAGLVKSWDQMDLHKKYEIIPAIGSDKYIHYDLLDKENRDKNLIKNIMDL